MSKIATGLLIVIAVLVVINTADRVFNKSTKIKDTVSIISTVDSIRISNKALIDAKAKIEQYTINENGEWIKRLPEYVIRKVPKLVPGTNDTIYIDTTKYINVAELDTTLDFKKENGITRNNLNIKYAYELGNLNFNYTSTLFDTTGKINYYKLRLNGIYDNGFWKVDINEDYNIKNTIKTITQNVYYEPDNSFWNRFVFGPNVSIGYDVTNKTIGTFIGFGVMYNLK